MYRRFIFNMRNGAISGYVGRERKICLMHERLEELVRRKAGALGLRKMTPRACVVAKSPYMRRFLSEALQDLRFITSECGNADELPGIFSFDAPDVILFGIAAAGISPGNFLKALVREEFSGKVLAIGAREAILTSAVQPIGRKYGLNMLPPLTTPFAAEGLRDRLAMLLPQEPAPRPTLHASDALHGGWLELWYQPKMDARKLVRRGAEAVLQVRHPIWGVVSPAHFVPESDGQHIYNLSDFLVDRVSRDWHYLLERDGPQDISINLPVALLKEPRASRNLCQRMPTHPAFRGLTIEINGDEIIKELGDVCELAREMSRHNVGLSIDNVGVNWPALMNFGKFSFVELKADPQFVTGCSEDPLKRTVCRLIVDLAREFDARTVAVGIESRADLVAINEIGFDLVQGGLFGEPTPLKKFARSSLLQAAEE